MPNLFLIKLFKMETVHVNRFKKMIIYLNIRTLLFLIIFQCVLKVYFRIVIPISLSYLIYLIFPSPVPSISLIPSPDPYLPKTSKLMLKLKGLK